jgi:4-aminobutyrate aminotransferase
MKSANEKIKKYIAPALSWDTELTAVHAEGIYVTVSDGRKFMDFSSGIAVLNVGHRHPRVMARIYEQLEHYMHSGCVFQYESLARLSEMLAEITPGGIDMFFYSNAGSEAVEGALKLARYVTGRQGIICFRGAFHGRTLGATSITSSNAKYRRHYRPLIPEVYRAPFPYEFRCPDGRVKGNPSLESLQFIRDMFKHEIYPDEVAAVIIEPQQGEGGYHPAPRAFLQGLREICDEHGILLIFDEVQSGMGRTGRWFAADHYGVAPDVICIAKSIAGGLPLSALGARRGIMEKWPVGAHGTTFGGNPVACAAGIGVIEAIKEEKLLENGTKLGRMIKDRFNSLKKKYPAIGDIRGLGCMVGVEFVKKDGSPDGDAFNHLFKFALDRNLIIVNCGPHGNVLRFIPPLVATPAEVEKGLGIIEQGLKAYKAK